MVQPATNLTPTKIMVLTDDGNIIEEVEVPSSSTPASSSSSTSSTAASSSSVSTNTSSISSAAVNSPSSEIRQKSVAFRLIATKLCDLINHFITQLNTLDPSHPAIGQLTGLRRSAAVLPGIDNWNTRWEIFLEDLRHQFVEILSNISDEVFSSPRIDLRPFSGTNYLAYAYVYTSIHRPDNLNRIQEALMIGETKLASKFYRNSYFSTSTSPLVQHEKRSGLAEILEHFIGTNPARYTDSEYLKNVIRQITFGLPPDKQRELYLKLIPDVIILVIKLIVFNSESVDRSTYANTSRNQPEHLSFNVCDDLFNELTSGLSSIERDNCAFALAGRYGVIDAQIALHYIKNISDPIKKGRATDGLMLFWARSSCLPPNLTEIVVNNNSENVLAESPVSHLLSPNIQCIILNYIFPSNSTNSSTSNASNSTGAISSTSTMTSITCSSSTNTTNDRRNFVLAKIIDDFSRRSGAYSIFNNYRISAVQLFNLMTPGGSRDSLLLNIFVRQNPSIPATS